MILIGHDMGLQAQFADRIMVMYAGNIVEIAPTVEIFDRPLHPYTQLLISSIPSIKTRKPLHVSEGMTHDLRNPPPGCIFQFRCPYRSRHLQTNSDSAGTNQSGAFRGMCALARDCGAAMSNALLEIRNATKLYGGKQKLVALQNFNLTVLEEPATITAIAGESGSGKTTLVNAVLGFVTLSSGEILYRGTDISKLDSNQMRAYRREVQAVFQDPYEVYNPFYRVKHIFDMVVENLGHDRHPSRD